MKRLLTAVCPGAIVTGCISVTLLLIRRTPFLPSVIIRRFDYEEIADFARGL